MLSTKSNERRYGTYLRLPDEEAMVRLTIKVALILHAAAVFAIWSVKLDSNPLACRKFRVADVSNSSLSIFN